MQSRNRIKKKKKLILSAADINNYQNKSGKILFLSNSYFLQYRELVEKKN